MFDSLIVFLQFLDYCVDELVGRENTWNDPNTKSEAIIETKNYVKRFYRTSVIEKDCKPDAALSDEVKEALKVCYDIRRDDIFQALAKECVLNKGHNLVENFDWKVKWILGSSDLATIKEPIVQVDLYCINKEKDTLKRNIVNFEANSEKLDELICALTQVKKELE